MPLDMDALETSFDLVAARGGELMERFYTRLFSAPSVRPRLAHVDMARQRAMLLAALVLLRSTLNDLDAVVPALRAMRARHVRHGTRREHYPVVGGVLVAALADVGGSRWQPRFSRAWAAAFELVAAALLDGAEGADLLAAA